MGLLLYVGPIIHLSSRCRRAEWGSAVNGSHGCGWGEWSPGLPFTSVGYSDSWTPFGSPTSECFMDDQTHVNWHSSQSINRCWRCLCEHTCNGEHAAGGDVIISSLLPWTVDTGYRSFFGSELWGHQGVCSRENTWIPSVVLTPPCIFFCFSPFFWKSVVGLFCEVGISFVAVIYSSPCNPYVHLGNLLHHVVTVLYNNCSNWGSGGSNEACRQWIQEECHATYIKIELWKLTNNCIIFVGVLCQFGNIVIVMDWQLYHFTQVVYVLDP